MHNQKFTLLKQLVLTEFKLRYQGSLLGHLWSLLKPLAIFAVLYVVFTQFLKIGNEVPYYPIYLFLGIISWNFITEATSSGMNAIVQRGDLLRKVNISKYTIILASSLSALINFLINLVIIVILMLILRVPFHASIFVAIPLFAELLLFCLGFALILSALFVRFRDISPIWDIVLQLFFYATPIVYPIASTASSVHLPGFVKDILLLNPAAQIIQDLRSVVLPEAGALTPLNHLPGLWPIIPYVLAIVPLILGYFYFKHEAKNFAENL